MVRTVKYASMRRRARNLPKPRRNWIWRVPGFLLGLAIRGLVVFVVVTTVLVLALRVVDPPFTPYSAAEYLRLGEIEQVWTRLEHFPRDVPLAVVAAEDSGFCEHSGIDFDALRAAWEDGANRGGSTLSQQLTKNLFLWQGRSWLRKALEAILTVEIELFWPKTRILEVYLNVAETGEGVFGFGGAAWAYYRKPVGELSQIEAARIAAILPDPKNRNPKRLSRDLNRRASQIATGGRVLLTEGRAGCFLERS